MRTRTRGRCDRHAVEGHNNSGPTRVEKTIRYKQFDITVEVELETFPSTRYRVTAHARRLNEARAWVTSQEFDSETAAYEFGLQIARAWVDEQEND